MNRLDVHKKELRYLLRAAAAILGEIAVYASIGIDIRLMADGAVRETTEDFNGEDIISFSDEPKTMRFVLLWLAKRHPDTSHLVPERPQDAVSCAKCYGIGEPVGPDTSGSLVVLGGMVCGECMGIGWMLPCELSP